MKKKVLTVILSIILSIAAVVGVGLILYANFLLPLQKKTRRNKQVILEYAEEHYPNAIVVDEYYESAKPFLMKIPRDYIKFEWNDIEFNIALQDGQVIIDGYHEARATAQIDNIIEAGFLKPRNIIAGTYYRFYDDYRETYPYTGNLYVELRAQGETPQEIWWLYDFYMYWKKEGAFFREYQVVIKIYEGGVEKGHLNFKSDSEFADEDEFYNSFKIY